MDWHERYLQQAAWTRDLRAYLLNKAGLAGAGRVLEVGCGTGVILRDLAGQIDVAHASRVRIHGLDLLHEVLLSARQRVPSAELARADALALPYPRAVFDITCCHFLLLWVADPQSVVQEMRRVTRRHGYVVAFAEPAYDQRIDHPHALARLGKLQQHALTQQGADPSIGSHLAGLFAEAGLHIIETGAIEQWQSISSAEAEWDAEWAVLFDDLRGHVPDSELRRLRQVDLNARRHGERILHVPTYFAFAQV